MSLSQEENEEFFDADDLVDEIEKKLTVSNEPESLLNEDFQSLPPIHDENKIKLLEEKIKQMEDGEKAEAAVEVEEEEAPEFSDEEDDRQDFEPLHVKLNREMKNKKGRGVASNTADEIMPDEDPFLVNEDQLKEDQESWSDEEKQDKLKEAQELKQSGNGFFKDEKFLEAAEAYTKAIRTCPLVFNKERAVFYSNRSLCFSKIKDLERCVSDCGKSIELDETFVKPVLRRAECYESMDKLDEALTDYKKLVELERSNVSYKHKCLELEEKINERNEKLKTEMMGKLKDLGNMFLKPFGMSTENFQFVQDPSTGSYSVNFKK